MKKLLAIFKIVNNFFYKLTGLEIVNRKKRNRYNLQNTLNKVIGHLHNINENNKFILFDVGGNRGHFVELFSEILKRKNIENYEIHYFEPIKFLCDEVEKKKYKNVIINNFGLGDKNEIKYFNEYNVKQDFSNRFGPIRGQSSYLEYISTNSSDDVKSGSNKYKMEIMTLETYCKKNKIEKINFIKIDTQAYNINVIKGGKEFFEKGLIDGIYTELVIAQIYEERETFYELEKNLYNKYQLFGIDVSNNQVEVVSRLSLKDYNLDVFYIKNEIVDNIN